MKDIIFYLNQHIDRVEVEPGNIKQIVCGAPNVGVGQKVIVANVGAVLPGDFKIKASKIRGVESNGMVLCAADGEKLELIEIKEVNSGCIVR